MKLNKWFLGTALAGMLTLSAYPVIASEYVVLDSNSNVVSKGQMLTGDVTISDGVELILMSSAGEVFTLTGPTTFSSERTVQENSDLVKALSSLFTAQNQSSAKLGAVRALTTGSSTDVTDPMNYPMGVSGTVCVVKGKDLVLERNTNVENSASITLTKNYKSGNTSVAPGEREIVVPNSFIATGGPLVNLTTGGRSYDYEVKFVEEAEGGKMLMNLAKEGCAVQANNLSQELVSEAKLNNPY